MEIEKPKTKQKKKKLKEVVQASEAVEVTESNVDASSSSLINNALNVYQITSESVEKKYDSDLSNAKSEEKLVDEEDILKNELGLSEKHIVEHVPLEENISGEQSISAIKQEEHTSIEEDVQLISPKKQEQTYQDLLLENKKLYNVLKLEQMEANTNCKSEQKVIIAKQISAVKSSTKALESTIQAYTESQLAALYANSELEALENFTSEFIEAELRGIAVKRHPLYEMLENYLQMRSKITANSLELEQLRKEYKECQTQLWSIEVAVINGRGECRDGNVVTTSYQYNKAIFHRSVFQTIGRILNTVRKLVTENYTLYSYSAEVLRLQIELYLQTLVTNCLAASQLPLNAPVILTTETAPTHLVRHLCELRLCVSVLFLFQRRLIRDGDFVKKTRKWLSKLIAVLLRLANWQDHLFILHHILRCPSGVASWASGFVQAPLTERFNDTPFANYQINHIIAVIATILAPIPKREQFLEQFAQTQENQSDGLWVIVDSEGEEDEETSGTALRENDFVQLLNQLPLDNLFRATLLVQCRDDQDHYESTLITEYHILRFLSFSTVLLRILRRGLQTYDQPRYNQFSKRLCRFIRHIVQYASDQWEHFQANQKLDDTAMMQRLQVEYDAFFLRATHYLYSSQRMGAWQFLAVVPYNMVSIQTLWRIFYLLHDNDNSVELILDPMDTTNFRLKLWEASLRTQFEEKLCLLADAECYYLLNTFANMVLARTEEDMDFIQTATMDLLQIGFISEATQESCSKNARILLTHVTSKYPYLLSDILQCVKKNMEKIGSLCLYLYEELPLSVWHPSDSDMEVISSWLIHNGITTNESRIARMIISRLNWDLTVEGMLFLPYSTHIKVALLCAKATEQEVGYLPWAWQTAFRLRVHLSDKGVTDFNSIPEVQRFDVINKGVREQQPFACFLSLLMTTLGHLVPLVCTKGLAQLQILQTHQKHDAILFSLYLIVPLFINCQESLINCEKFQIILVDLLNADRGYINMAKSLVVPQNTVLQQFGNMIECQIFNFLWYGLESPRCMVRLWMNSLVSVPNWNKDYGVMFLLDVILRAAFFHADALDVAASILKELLQCATPQEQTNSISSLFKWVSSSPNTPAGSLLTASSLSTCTWLAYILIALEHEEREVQTGLWKEVLTQLKNQKGKVNVDAAIKKAAAIVKVPSFTSSSLCIYRWAQQALDTAIDHSLLPLLWQKFFLLYLTRVPVAGAVDRGCVGDKFFEGIINLTFLKRLKKRLQETVDFYQKKTEDSDDEDDVTNKQFYLNCHRVFKAYSLWLEEPRLQEANLYLPGLPTQYEPQLLALIVQGNSTPWLEYVNYDKVKSEQQVCIKTWRTSVYREKKNINQPLPHPGSGVESGDPVERILRRLTSYDQPKPAPALVNSAPIIPPLNISDKAAMFKTLDQHFKNLKQFAHNHSLKVSEHKAIDSTYRELAPQLYRSVLCKVKKQVPCKIANQTVHCSGAAVISLEMQEARINEGIEHQIMSNRHSYESMLTKSLQPPAQALCISSITVQKTIDLLQTQLPSDPSLAEMGVELFYYILSLITEETNLYPPTKLFITTSLEKLGQSHIYGVDFETPRLLNKILQVPALAFYLTPHFSPVNSGTANFLHMYSTICNEIGPKYDVIFALLSKFDVSNWLVTKQPKISQRSQFIELIIKALTTLGFEPPNDSIMLHEVYRRHLICIFEYQFPEHYGDVLLIMLRGSNGGTDSGCIAISVWMDVLNSLARPLQLKLGNLMRDQLRLYAQQQRILSYQELLETATLLAKHFSNERLQYGLYGLYPKYRNYMEVLVLLMGMTGHGLIISALNTHQGVLGDKLCEIIWPYVRDMVAPWIIPYWMQNIKENMAAWMQQLTDDRAALLPWIPADGPFAQKVVHIFFECIQFIIHTLPACNNILSFVWHWYVTNFAHASVKDHVLNVVHASFLALPWHNFWPSIGDVEFMLKVVEQYLPECHVFLGHIFMEISWPNWLSHLSKNTPVQVNVRVHQCLLHLLVKLSNEPNVRNNHAEKAKSLLVQAESFHWAILEPSMYQQIMDWYVMSCDSLVLFSSDPLNLDFRILHFLKTVANYDKVMDDSSIHLLQKRHIYVRSYVKLIAVLTSRYKTIVPTRENEFISVINSQLNHMETVIKSEEELNVILAEMCGILNISAINKVTVKCFEQWIANKSADGLIISAVLKTLASNVTDNEIVAVLLEACINSYFFNNVSQNTVISWNHAAKLLRPFSPKQAELENVLVTQGRLLTLHALLLQKIPNCSDYLILLNTILQWLTNIKLSVSVEEKLPLLWSQILCLSLRYCEYDESAAGTFLHKFAQLLLQMCPEKNMSGWGKGLLGAIGIVKQDNISPKFRFLSRAVAGYILAQLPDAKGESQIVRLVPNAPCTVGQPGGNTECVKILMGLDLGQSQGEIKTSAELALKQIQDPANSLYNARKFLSLLLTRLYTKPYFKDIDT